MTTRAEIEELAKKPREELTSKERSLVALLPLMNEKGCTAETRRGGKKKGTHNWSFYFRKLMDDPKFMTTINTTRPQKWGQEYGDYPAEAIAAGVITIVTKSVMDAIQSGKTLDKSTLKALELIGKLGYGEKVVHDIDEDSFFDRTDFHFTVVPDRNQES